MNWTTNIQTQGDVDSVVLKQKLTDYWESVGLSVGYIVNNEDTGEFYIVGRGSGDSVIKSIGVIQSVRVTPPSIGITVLCRRALAQRTSTRHVRIADEKGGK